MAIDTKLSSLILNELSKAQFNSITPNPNELYLVTDDNISANDVILDNKTTVQSWYNSGGGGDGGSSMGDGYLVSFELISLNTDSTSEEIIEILGGRDKWEELYNIVSTKGTTIYMIGAHGEGKFTITQAVGGEYDNNVKGIQLFIKLNILTSFNDNPEGILASYGTIINIEILENSNINPSTFSATTQMAVEQGIPFGIFNQPYGIPLLDANGKLSTSVLSKNIINSKDGSSINIWTGTQAQYDNISSKDINTLYFIE